MSERSFRVGVVGATGLVGSEIVSLLEERAFPVADLRLYATEESAGTEIVFRGEPRIVEALPEAFPELDLVFLCATAEVSERIGPALGARGALVIDLEAGGEGARLVLGAGDVANGDTKRPLRLADPAARLVVAPLRALAEAARPRRVVATLVVPASTFGRNSVVQLGEDTIALLNARGSEGEDEESEEESGDDAPSFAFRCVPLDSAVLPISRIEAHVRQLLGADLAVSLQAVRTPIFFGGMVSLAVEMDRSVSLDDIRKVLREAPSLILVEGDVAGRSTFDTLGIDAIQITGLRQDAGSPEWIHFWALADNVRQGAALPAVSLAEGLLLRH